MIENLLVFVLSLFLVIKGATLATKYSAKLAESFKLSKYVVGFIIVAFISILPEALISINSAIKGVPSFGLGTLFGSNIADLTLIFALLIIYVGRGMKIESKILKNLHYYPFFLALPIVLGLNGSYSRIEGTLLIVTGLAFYYAIFKNNADASAILHNGNEKLKCFFLLLLAMVLLLVGAHLTVTSATQLAHSLAITPVLIGMLVVGLGTTMPELFFSMKSLENKDDGLAVGDILGSVLADATIVVGILAFINPFNFPVKIIYITGAFMMISSLILLKFMRSGRTLSKREGYLLMALWVSYVIIELMANM